MECYANDLTLFFAFLLFPIMVEFEVFCRFAVTCTLASPRPRAAISARYCKKDKKLPNSTIKGNNRLSIISRSSLKWGKIRFAVDSYLQLVTLVKI